MPLPESSVFLEAFQKDIPHIVEEGCPEPWGVSCGLRFGRRGSCTSPTRFPDEVLTPRGLWVQVWLWQLELSPCVLMEHLHVPQPLGLNLDIENAVGLAPAGSLKRWDPEEAGT